jgi:hypothetical protein
MKRAIFLLSLFCLSTSLIAQGLFESATQASASKSDNTFQLGGYVRGSAFGGGEVFDYTNTFGEVSLQAKLKTDNFLMNSDIRFRGGYQFGQPASEMEIKEAYAGISLNSFDLLLGEQIVSWGRTDGFNPTNNINPNNYFFFSSNPDDQKLPNFMLKANLRFSTKMNWEIIALPIFRPSMYRYDLFDMGDNISFVDAVLPDITFENASLATKLNFELSKVGFSISWFRGYDPFYGFDLKNVDFSTGNPVITYIPSFYKKNSIGVDFALPVEAWIIRGEGAFSLTENKDNKMYIPNDEISYVVGIEHNFGGWLAIAQYIGKQTLGFASLTEPVLLDPTNMLAQLQYANAMINYESTSFNRKIFHQQESVNHAASIAISKDFAYETVNVELSGYYDFTSEEYLIRPKIAWKIGGGLTASAGYVYMKGPDKSVFSYASPIMNGAFIELKTSF